MGSCQGNAIVLDQDKIAAMFLFSQNKHVTRNINNNNTVTTVTLISLGTKLRTHQSKMITQF